MEISTLPMKHINSDKAQQQSRSIEYKLGERIAYLRNRMNWSQAEFAQKADVSQSTIAQIESGKKDPSVATLIKLAEALSVHPALLFAGNEVHVLDMRKMRSKYKSVGDLNDTLYRALGEVTRYAKEIGFTP